MEKLKACPFCGGKVEMCEQSARRGDTIVKRFVVGCPDCISSTGMSGAWLTEKQAAAAWNRRAAPENKALTLFDKITESPEKLAKFLGAIDIGKIELDECFCKSDCGDDSGCPHELQCIINWLDKPAAASIRWTQK